MIDVVQKPVIQYSDKNNKQALTLVPNFMFFNKPIIKNKKKVKELVIWFDIKANNSVLDYKNLNYKLNFSDIKFQLVLTKDNKQTPLLIEKKNIVDISNVDIWYKNGVLITEKIPLVYEIDEELIDKDNITLDYVLAYKNNDHIGSTWDGVNGKSKGNYNLNLTNSSNEVNNVISYIESSYSKSNVINRNKLELEESDLNQFDDVNKPLLKINVKNEGNIPVQITLNDVLRAKLGDLSKLTFSYLDIEQKGFKTVKKDDSYYVYKEVGNRWDYSKNKLLDNSNSSGAYYEESSFKLNFDYSGYKFEKEINLKPFETKIKVKTNQRFKNKKTYITYDGVKPNTRFETFIAKRNLSINEN